MKNTLIYDLKIIFNCFFGSTSIWKNASECRASYFLNHWPNAHKLQSWKGERKNRISVDVMQWRGRIWLVVRWSRLFCQYIYIWSYALSAFTIAVINRAVFAQLVHRKFCMIFLGLPLSFGEGITQIWHASTRARCEIDYSCRTIDILWHCGHCVSAISFSSGFYALSNVGTRKYWRKNAIKYAKKKISLKFLFIEHLNVSYLQILCNERLQWQYAFQRRQQHIRQNVKIETPESEDRHTTATHKQCVRLSLLRKHKKMRHKIVFSPLACDRDCDTYILLNIIALLLVWFFPSARAAPAQAVAMNTNMCKNWRNATLNRKSFMGPTLNMSTHSMRDKRNIHWCRATSICRNIWRMGEKLVVSLISSLLPIQSISWNSTQCENM